MPSVLEGEIRLHRMHTRLLIARYPTRIVINRPPPLVDDGQGGMQRPNTPPTVLPAQNVFFSGLNSNGRSLTATRWDITDRGERFLTRFVIVGEYNANLEEDDWFMFQGRKIKISDRFPDRTYQTKCEAVAIDG